MHLEPFDACWHRWERAETHRAALARIWNDYIDDHPYEVALISEGGGSYILRVWQTQPMPAEFGVTMGEWLYNLRSSLDYIIWATAVYSSGQLPPPREDALQYPIYETEEVWTRNARRLAGLAPHQRAMLELMQPFNGNRDANFLGWINRLARIDRHRRLVDGTAYLAEVEPVVQVPEGKTVNLEWGERVLGDGYAEVARLTVSPWDEDTEVAVNPRIGIDPEIREWSASPFWGPKRFGDRLRMMQVFVSTEICAYEYDCTGASRKAHLLSEGFREESDARRSPKPIQRTARFPVNWAPADPGRLSTSQDR